MKASIKIVRDVSALIVVLFVLSQCFTALSQPSTAWVVLGIVGIMGSFLACVDYIGKFYGISNTEKK